MNIFRMHTYRYRRQHKQFFSQLSDLIASIEKKNLKKIQIRIVIIIIVLKIII